MSSFLSRAELACLGLASVGENVSISRLASLHGVERIRLGSHVRIDDFCVLSAGSGGIDIGSFVHVAVYTSLIGRGRIKLGDYANLSSRVSVYSSSDDYSGDAMTNPMIPVEFTNVRHADVDIGRHVIIGCGSVVLPGAILNDGAAIGALSLVDGNCEAFWMYAGIPVRRIRARSRRILELEARMVGGQDP